MSRSVYNYKFEDWVGGHGDTFKLIVLCTVLKHLQDAKPSLLLSDCMAGDGVYNLNEHTNAAAYQKGILHVLNRENEDSIPPVVKTFIETVYKATGCSGAADLDVMPGSPVIGQHLLRPKVDEHRLTDNNVEQVQWLSENSDFVMADALASLEFLLPYTCDDDAPHPVFLIDPSYEKDEDYKNVKSLMTTILEQHPYATIIVWIPFIENHPFRFSFPTSMRELAKKHAKGGRYFASMNISKTGFQGSCVLVCNPAPGLDDLLDDTAVHWLANTMNQGKDEFMVEQIMKKKKEKK
jgi:23S rRNA (adenine2030-N6)-methyltransferase